MSKIFGMDICPSICSRLSKTLPPMRAHWRHLANTFELVLHSAHPSPKLKWQVDWFSRFCTAHGRKSPYFTMGAPIPQNWLFPRGSGPHPTRFLGPIWPRKPNSILIGSAVFVQMTEECPYTLQWDAPFPLKIAPSHRGSHSLSPPKSSTLTASWSVQRFCRAH